MLNVLDHLGVYVLHDENRITLPKLDTKLKHLNTKKAKGHDWISNKIISYILSSLTPILHPLHNILVCRGHYPLSTIPWPRAMGLMILKPCSFLPISLLCNLGKVFESIVATRLYSCAESTNLLPPEQSGFRKKRSVTTGSFNLHRSLRDNLPDTELHIFLDVEKAVCVKNCWICICPSPYQVDFKLS